MTKPAKKIWCPQCHKRHRLPANAIGVTLRCRGCKFAFPVEEGLQSDPKSRTAAENTAAVNQSAKVRKQASRPTASKTPASSKEAIGGTSSESSASGSGTAILDNEYDDILSVLETPVSEQAPPRALAKRSKPKALNRTVVKSEDLVEAPQRPPITREQLRSHRNARQFWMLVCFLASAALGLFCFVYVNLFMSPDIGSWEREILYSFGVPARWLPPAENGDDSLPAVHVKLRGDHAELADRDEFFRDDFADIDRAKEGPDDNAANRKNAFERGPRIVDNAPRVKNVAPRAMGMNRQPPRRAFRDVAPPWNPPELSVADLQRAASRGIDPKFLRSITLEGVESQTAVLANDTLFFLNSKNHLAAFSAIDGGLQIAHRKLGNDVAAMCPAAVNEITARPSVWIHFDSGKLEKWELDGANLSPAVQISTTKAVFRERNALLTANEDRIAFVHQGKIFSADVLPAAGRIANPVEVPVPGKILAIKLGLDDATVLAVTASGVLQIDSRTGNVEQEFKFDSDYEKVLRDQSLSIQITEDLGTILLVRGGMIDSLQLIDGKAELSGRYWASSPMPIESVLVSGKTLAGLSMTPAAAEFTVFKMSAMERTDFVASKKPAKKSGPARSRLPERMPERDAVEPLAGVPALPNQPYLTSLSPKLSQRIHELKFSKGKIAFLIGARNSKRLAIADAQNNWDMVTLNINAGDVNHFSISPDFQQIVIAAGEVVQSWRIDDVETGEVTLVAEFPGHVDDVTKITLVPGGKHVLSGDRSGKIFSWDFESGETTGEIDDLQSEVVDIVAYSESAFVAMDRASKVKGSLTTVRKSDAFPRRLSGTMAISENGRKFAFTFRNEVQIANSSFKKFDRLEGSEGVTGIQFAKDQRYIVLGDREQVTVWDLRKKQQVRRFRVPGKTQAGPYTISDDGRFVAVVVGAENDQIAIFEMPEAE